MDEDLEAVWKFPNKFVQEHGKKIPDMVRLSIPTGGCWDVRVKREIDGTIWLHDGFLNFTEDNCIGFEYLLIFKYDWNSKFLVHIFDLTATEIPYKCSRNSERCNNVVNEDETGEGRDDSLNYYESNPNDSVCGKDVSFTYEIGDKDSNDNATDDNTSKNQNVYEISDDSFKYESGDQDSDDSSIEYLGSTKDGLLPQVFPEPSEFASKDNQNEAHATTRSDRMRTKRQLIEGGLDPNRSMCAASATHKFSRQTKHSSDDGSNISPRDIPKELITKAKRRQPMVPNSFRVTIQPYHIEKGFMRLPCKFARLHMCYTTTLVKLVGTDNKEWQVSCLQQGYNYILSRGWCRFVRDMGLVVGDICVFKHIRSDEEVKLKVNII